VAPVVLDASALLAYWLDEPGAPVVERAIADHGAVVSAPNFAEALSKVIDARPALANTLPDPAPRTTSETAATVPDMPMAGGAIVVEPFTLQDAVLCAKLRPVTKSVGLSLGDRACLALARRLGAPALTADGAWVKLDVGVAVTLIRGAGVR
jgi:PIN domain nuclease of toxin-antitoxin system